MYNIIYTDPPWPQEKGGKRVCRPNQGKDLDYHTMELPDIVEYHKEILKKAEQKHNVFMWAIDKFLPETEILMRELGYKLHARFIWNKTNGVCPAFTIRFSHEYLLWFFKPGNILMPRKEARGKYATVFTEPSTIHSRKPEIAYQMIEDMWPDANKLELFARRKRKGWDSIGDELQDGNELW
ncbi:DNA methyltransferase [Spirochaetia bacterium]|nr:DNA methyltransferase [Spirochaetia bacterium]